MKILILSCDTGCGHNSAAAALSDELRRRGIEHTVFDPLTLGGKRTDRIVSASYSGMLRKAPSAFGVIYRVGDLYSSTGITSPVYLANAVYAKKLQAYITNGGYDRVICTHLFAMEAMTAIKRRLGGSVPCYGVMTDYTCVPFFAETQLDGYFIPHEDLREEHAKKGIPCDRIWCTGIPVRERFTHHTDKAEARAALGMPADAEIALVMSGGVGCGNIGEICSALLKKQTGKLAVFVLTGRNAQMKQELDGRFSDVPALHTVSFTDKVNLYMNASDVMISKPGGLTSTEAAVSGIPLVQLLTYTGCEKKNIAFFSSHGMSAQAESPEDAAEKAAELIRDREKAEAMLLAQRRNASPEAARIIVEKVTEQ